MPTNSYGASPKSKNAYAKSIKTSVGKLDKKFAKGKTAYVVNLAADKASTKLTFAKAHKKAKVKVKVGSAKWSKYSSKAKLAKTIKVGQGKSVVVKFTVKAQSGKTKTYKVTVKRANAPPAPVTAPAPTPTPDPTPAPTPTPDPTPPTIPEGPTWIYWDPTANGGVGNFRLSRSQLEEWQSTWRLYGDNSIIPGLIMQHTIDFSTGEIDGDAHLVPSGTTFNFEIIDRGEDYSEWISIKKITGLVRP